MRETFLTPEDENAFLDIPQKLSPDKRDHDDVGPWVECPVCKGHGYWNLKINCYPERNNDPNTKHFRAGCNQCNNWGWVRTGSLNETCVPHEPKELSYNECKKRGIHHWGTCWHVYECTKCGQIRSYDSSD